MSEWKTRRSMEFKHLERMNGADYIIDPLGLQVVTPEGPEDGYRVLDKKSREVFYGSHDQCQKWINKKTK